MKIVFVYPKRFAIYPPDYLERGLGGTESLFVTLTKELAKMGHKIIVYANAYKEGTYDHVEWRSIWRAHTDKEEYDFRVILRYLEAFDYPLNVRKTVLWSHDNYYDDIKISELFVSKQLDNIIVVSKYHKHITQNFLPKYVDRIIEIPNSYDSNLYNSLRPTKKEKYKCIYCSVPIRGLDYLLDIWDELSKVLPEAKLYVTSDMTLWGSTKQDDRHVMNSLYLSLNSRKNIVRLGNIPKEEVAYHQATSELMLYPTDFDELFCISALECLSVDTPVISTYRAGLIERVTSENDGLLIKGDPRSSVYKEQFLDATLSRLMNNEDGEIQNEKISDVSSFAIENIAKIWNDFFNS